MDIQEPRVLCGFGKKNSNGGTQYFQQDRVYSSDGLAVAHPASIPGGSYRYMFEEKSQETEYEYRIRKLTPRECGRLMGVSDSDIDKMEEVNSNTQLYKQFGNSIVVPVMEHLFRTIVE